MIDAGNAAADKLSLVIKQLLAIGRDVPGFHLAAQILVEHRTEKEVVLVAHQRNLARSGQIEDGKKAAKTAANNQNSRLFLSHKIGLDCEIFEWQILSDKVSRRTVAWPAHLARDFTGRTPVPLLPAGHRSDQGVNFSQQ